jgi:hypothetical protein
VKVSVLAINVGFRPRLGLIIECKTRITLVPCCDVATDAFIIQVMFKITKMVWHTRHDMITAPRKKASEGFHELVAVVDLPAGSEHEI